MYYDVRVTAQIKQTLADASVFDLPAELKKTLPPPTFSSRVKIVSEGHLRSDKNRIVLEFSDSESRYFEISFSRKEPSLITLRRREAEVNLPPVLVLEKGIRHRCINSGVHGEKMELTVIASDIDNRLLRSGKMILRYAVEICGAHAEYTEITLNVEHSV